MSIIFDNGKRVISDVVVSTALGQSGMGMFPYTIKSSEYRKLVRLVKKENITVFSKSSTRFKRKGNFRIYYPWTWKYINKISYATILNAYGLTNDGVEKNAKKISASCEEGFNVIPSYYPEFEKGIDTALRELTDSVLIYAGELGDNFWAIELNGSCPNSDEIINENMDALVKCIKPLKTVLPGLVIIVKTSIVHPYSFYKRLEDAGVDVIHAINTIPYGMVFPGNKSPLAKKGGGGVSGFLAYDLAYRYNQKLREKTKLPIIMGCGVTDIYSKVQFFRIGADVVSVCTAALLNPKEACHIVTPVSNTKS